MPLSKKQIAEKKEIQLEENVRLLRSGAWGYIHEGVAIYRCENVEVINEFSLWANQKYFDGNDYDYIRDFATIDNTAKALQFLIGEPKIMPKCHLCDAPHWSAGSNNYEAVVRQQSIMTNK